MEYLVLFAAYLRLHRKTFRFSCVVDIVKLEQTQNIKVIRQSKPPPPQGQKPSKKRRFHDYFHEKKQSDNEDPAVSNLTTQEGEIVQKAKRLHLNDGRPGDDQPVHIRESVLKFMEAYSYSGSQVRRNTDQKKPKTSKKDPEPPSSIKEELFPRSNLQLRGQFVPSETKAAIDLDDLIKEGAFIEVYDQVA